MADGGRLSFLACALVILAALVPGSLGQANTTTPPPTTGTTPASNGTLLLRIKINGAFVDLTNCTLTNLGDVACNSNMQHDVLVKLAESLGTESWVSVMLWVNFGLVAVFGIGLIVGYILWCVERKKNSAPQEYQPVPGQEQPTYYDPQGGGYPGPYQYAQTSKKVISVGLIKASLPSDAIMA
jgi:hypothetical protein